MADIILQKKALMIAPSYSALPKDYLLTGTIKDVETMKKVLMEKCAFEKENITVLQGDQATKDNILKVLDEFTCEDDSVVFVYYSGHGAYLKYSQDEGLIPTLYEWPVKIPWEDAFITGNDLFTFLDKLAKKHARVTMILDCCHSGQLYRVIEFDQTTGLKPKQVILERGLDEPPPPKQYTKADRGGWTPDDKDFFFYFAACTTVQTAAEEIDKGGRLTMAIVNVLNNLKSLDEVSYDAFFRLVNKEFKERCWDKSQTPQFEAANSHTVLFGTSQVKQQEGGILITKVCNEDEVFLGSGFLQNLRAGKYNVFEPTATAESVNEGSSSKHWVALIDVNEGLIDMAQSVGKVVHEPMNRQITVGCLAYLKTPESVNNNVYVDPVPDSVSQDRLKDLLDQLMASNMLNVSRHLSSVKDPDLITISVEKIKEQDCWVARRRGKVLVPPISLAVGSEGIMANNLCRYIRYHLVLERAQSPADKEDLLENVTLNLFKVENVKPYNKRTKKDRIREGLAGKDISQALDERPTFKAHKNDQNDKLIDGTGDAFIFQVINNKEKVEDTVHICVMLYQLDGAIRAIYPKKKGRTIELRGGGDTAEEIYRQFIPKDSLRQMVEPDLDNDEPNKGVDTLVLYASNKAVDYGPLEQSCMQTDRKLMQRGSGEDKLGLSSLEEFLKLRKRPVTEDDVTEDFKYCIKKVEMTVEKHS